MGGGSGSGGVILTSGRYRRLVHSPSSMTPQQRKKARSAVGSRIERAVTDMLEISGGEDPRLARLLHGQLARLQVQPPAGHLDGAGEPADADVVAEADREMWGG